MLSRDKNTRQAIINIGDTLKDTLDSNLNIKETKDCPCTRILHFMKHPSENKLNLTVYMRSNDILWGASAVNIFNFTLIQEYFAKLFNNGMRFAQSTFGFRNAISSLSSTHQPNRRQRHLHALG